MEEIGTYLFVSAHLFFLIGAASFSGELPPELSLSIVMSDAAGVDL
jgi:hypothetical protein